MLEHTSDSPNFKVCANGDKCLHPGGSTLPLSEFYLHSNDKPQNKCKFCMREYSRQRPYLRKADGTTWRKSEQEVIDHLRQQGVYAVSGIASEWTWVDIVAWGCVRIELKTARLNADGKFQFNLSARIRKNWDKNDLVILVCKYDKEQTYHVFPKSHPAFYHEDGTPKVSVVYAPDRRWVWANGNALSTDLMNQHRDMWGLIEDRRSEWQCAMRIKA